jgi:hypothetical protein
MQMQESRHSDKTELALTQGAQSREDAILADSNLTAFTRTRRV